MIPPAHLVIEKSRCLPKQEVRTIGASLIELSVSLQIKLSQLNVSRGSIAPNKEAAHAR